MSITTTTATAATTENAAPPRLLDLPLDLFDVRVDKADKPAYWVHDAVEGSGREFRIHGTPTVVPDDYFGSALALDGAGTFIDLTSLAAETAGHGQEAVSVSAWVRVNEGPKSTMKVLPLAGVTGLWLVDLNNLKPGFSVWLEGVDTPLEARAKGKTFTVTPGSWVHIAGVFDRRTASMYVDGQLAGTAAVPAEVPDDHLSMIYFHEAAPMTVGRSGNADLTSSDPTLPAQVARLRMHAGALTAEQIQRMRSEDRSLQSAFQAKFPFDFELIDDDVRNVIYITDIDEQTMTASIRNTSGVPLHWTPLEVIEDAQGEFPNASAHHLELRFRPGTFRQSLPSAKSASKATKPLAPALEVLKKSLPKGWVASRQLVPAADGQSSSLFFAHVAGRPKVGSKPLEPGDALDFELRYGTADGQMGSRGTNVILGFQNAHWRRENQTQVPLDGEKISTLDVVNQSGKREVPLHVGFVETNLVLNTVSHDAGTTPELALRMINTLPKVPDYPDRNHLRFRSLHTAEGSDASAATKFTLTWDTEEDWKDESWALTQLANAKQVSITWRLNGKIQTEQTLQTNDQGMRVSWSFEPTVESLGPGEYIDLVIENLTAIGLPSGPANITVRYEDLPGYWDGQFILPVEKGPIFHQDKKVGIGTTPSDTDHRLQVAGGVRILDGMTCKGQVGIDNGFQNEHGATLVLGPMGASNLRLGYHQNYSWIQSHGLKPLAINPAGNFVGVCTSSPRASLHVGGDAIFDGRVTITAQPDNEHGTTLVLGDTGSSNLRLGYHKDYSWIQSHGGKPLYINKAGNRIYHGNPAQTLSDAGMKTAVRDIDNALDVVQQIRPRRFAWRSDGSEDLGVVAQELAEVLPELVSEVDGKMAVSYNSFGVLAIAALREQQAIINDLRTRLEALES